MVLILKVNTAGVQIGSFGGNPAFQEMWRAEYNRCINKIVIAGHLIGAIK